MLQKNLPILSNFEKNEGTLEAQMRYTDIERTIYDIKMDSNNAFEKIDLNENIIGNFNINQSDFELSNSELIFWNVETNKCFIISHTDESASSWGHDQNVNSAQNEEVESQTIGNDLSKNIEEMRKILETDSGEVNDDVEEEMRKMFDENNISSIMKDNEVFERVVQNQSEDRQIEDDCNNFQLEESHYENIIEIASEQLVNSSQNPPTLYCASDKGCEIVLTTEGGPKSKGNKLLEHFQAENVKSIIADSIDEKRQRLHEIRNRISKIHIHLSKKRKCYECLQNNFSPKRNKSMSPNLHTISKPDQVTQFNNLKKVRDQKPKRIDAHKKILIRWRKKFEKQINTNYTKQTTDMVKCQKNTETKTNLPTAINSEKNTNNVNNLEPSYFDIPNNDEKRKDEQPATSTPFQNEKVSEMDNTNLETIRIEKHAIEAQLTEQPLAKKLEENDEKAVTDDKDTAETQFEIHEVTNIEHNYQHFEKNPAQSDNSRPLTTRKESPLLIHDSLRGNDNDITEMLSKKSRETGRPKLEVAAQNNKSQVINFTLKKISPVKFELCHRILPQDELFRQIKSVTFLKTINQQNNKVYEHFIQNIDDNTYHQSRSFNLDTINYTFRWLQYILSRKLHKSEMETELEKLKVHYYRLFHLNLIRCCGSGAKIRKHCECSDKLNRVVFCTLMDTYVLRIVKYIILAFQNNFGNIVNSTETIAGFLSFFIDRSKILYFLFLYKSNFLQKEQIALEKTAKPKSLRSLTRMCLLKMICKNPKMHECMENIEDPKRTKECIVPVMPDPEPVKSFNSSHSIENLLQKPVEAPLNLVLNREKRTPNSLQPRTKQLLNYRHKVLEESNSIPTQPEVIVNLPEHLTAMRHTSKSQFVTNRRKTIDLATSNRLGSFVHRSGKLIDQEYLNFNKTQQEKINKDIQPPAVHPQNVTPSFYYSTRLQNLKNRNNKNVHLAPDKQSSYQVTKQSNSQIDISHTDCDSIIARENIRSISDLSTLDLHRLTLQQRLHSQKTDIEKQYTTPSQNKPVGPFQRRRSLHQQFPHLLSNPTSSSEINKFNNFTNRMIAGSHFDENPKHYFNSLNLINPTSTAPSYPPGYPLNKSTRFGCNDNHQTNTNDKRINILSNIMLTRTNKSNQEVDATETIIISDAEDGAQERPIYVATHKDILNT